MKIPHINPEDLEILPLEKSATIPSDWYTDEEHFNFEKGIIFEKEWQYAGHINQLNKPGDFFLLEVSGNPLIVIKGDDGTIKGFYNVCRHRGGPLAFEDGNCRMLQCKYHGWTYKTDGSLRGVPRFDRVDLFDKKDYGLIPVEIDFWEGLIFVRLSKGDKTLSSLVNGITGRISPINLTQKKFYARVKYKINCNWKTYVDNYLEGYHLPYVHPELCDILDVKEYITETAEYNSLQRSITKELGEFYKNDGNVFYYFIYPNFMLNILPGRLQTNLVLPVEKNKSLVIFDYLYDDISEMAVEKIKSDIEYSDKVQQEDIQICEHVQKGLESKAYHKGRFSVECEAGVHHFQSLLKKSYQVNL
jgi:choline monooxygenase